MGEEVEEGSVGVLRDRGDRSGRRSGGDVDIFGELVFWGGGRV